MEPILLIGAAAVAVAVAVAAFARRIHRRHKMAVPSPPPRRSLGPGNVQIIKSQETAPAGVEPRSTKTGPESKGEASLSRRAELIEPVPEEVLKRTRGDKELWKAETPSAQEARAETIHSPESPAYAGAPVADEGRIGVESENESARGIADRADAANGPGVNLAGEGARVPNQITGVLPGPTGCAGNDFTESGAAAPDLAAGTENLKEVDAAAGSASGPDVVEVTAGVESLPEDETERTASAQLEEAASSDSVAQGEELKRPDYGTKSPRQYRPVVRTRPKPDVPSVPKDQRVQRERALSLEVRLVFEPGGFCRLSLMPQRLTDLPQELLVSGAEGEVELAALQEDWYQDVTFADTGRFLRRGIEWEATLPEGRRVRWSVSGREIYVLAPHDSLSGFVSAPRLVLGEQHVVLSAAERRADVLRAIEVTGSPEPEVIGAAEGMPSGWMGFRGVIPHKPVAPSLAGDILDTLCPLANTEIVLKGGIRIGRSAWLKEYPPVIQLHGDDSNAELTIDGRDAKKDESGAYTNHGWDLPGDHLIWTASASRSYSISAGLESWDPWDAYGWSWEESSGKSELSRPTICGVLVRSPRNAAAGSRGVIRSGSNPIFIGASIGEIEVCRTPPGVRTNVAIGFPAFDPVWAVPADALHSDKRVARVVLVGSPRVPEATNSASAWRSASNTRHARRQSTLRARAWCSVILDVGRKGLQPEPNTIEICALWEQYRRTAKLVWRALR
jgi:hypothetical protein